MNIDLYSSVFAGMGLILFPVFSLNEQAVAVRSTDGHESRSADACSKRWNLLINPIVIIAKTVGSSVMRAQPQIFESALRTPL